MPTIPIGHRSSKDIRTELFIRPVTGADLTCEELVTMATHDTKFVVSDASTGADVTRRLRHIIVEQ